MKMYFGIEQIMFCILIYFQMLFIPVIIQAELSVSHDPSEIILICWFGPKESSLIIINAEKNCAC